jgi:predicted transcriptional regulator
MRIQVKDFMSSPVITAKGNDSVRELRAVMTNKGIHAIPIITQSNQLPNLEVTIRGIVTLSDLCKNIDEKYSAEDIMTDKVHVIHKDSSAESAAKMMLKHEVHHIVVMDEGKIIGMISSLDFVKLVAEYKLE